MRFMTMVKGHDAAGPPPQALIDAIGKLGEEATKAGKLIEMGGLYPTAAGTRVRLSGGKITVTDGPFTEAKEVVRPLVTIGCDLTSVRTRFVSAASWPSLCRRSRRSTASSR